METVQMQGKYRLLAAEGRAKRGELQTVHGTIQTPVFMNVGTQAAIKERFRPWTLKRSALRSSFRIRIISM